MWRGAAQPGPDVARRGETDVAAVELLSRGMTRPPGFDQPIQAADNIFKADVPVV